MSKKKGTGKKSTQTQKVPQKESNKKEVVKEKKQEKSNNNVKEKTDEVKKKNVEKEKSSNKNKEISKEKAKTTNNNKSGEKQKKENGNKTKNNSQKEKVKKEIKVEEKEKKEKKQEEALKEKKQKKEVVALKEKKEKKQEVVIKDKKEEKNNLQVKPEKKEEKPNPSSFVMENKPKKKKRILLKIFIIFLILVLLCIIGIFTIPSLIVSNKNQIISGISINGNLVEGLTVEEAKEKLNTTSNEITNSNLKLIMGEYESDVNLSQISAKYDIDKAIDEAYKEGRNENIIQNSYNILMAKYKGKNIEIGASINSEELNNIFNNISQELPGHVVQWSYSVEKEKTLIITKGKRGVVIDEEETARRIQEALINMLKGDKVETIELATIEKDPDPVDVDKIHNEVFREPKDAYVTQNPFGVYVHVDGIDFNVDEVKNLLQSNDEEYKIDLTITHPKVMTKDLGQEAFPDILGKTYKTTYSAGDVNRNTNIELAARTVNGTILMPGETFSYNGILGDTTADKGYKPGGAYLNGEVVQSYGGGICQVSSTIYNAVLYANLQVDERYNHSFLSGYVPAGLDATVSYGSKDFKFTNNRKFPIKLVCTAKNGVISATIYGVKQDDDCDVELESVITSYIAPTVKYESTNTLKKGVEQVKQSGSSGCKCTVYITLSRNGKQISREVLHHDVYSAKQKIILRGTKK